MSERQTSIPFARSRASKKRNYIVKPMTPEEMRADQGIRNRVLAQEQAKMRERKVTISAFFYEALHFADYRRGLRLAQFKERGQFKGGIAV